MYDIQQTLKSLTLEEKVSLCSGAGFWNTVDMPGHGIPAMNLTDGPHGVRKQGGEADHLGINESNRTTCFPTAAGLACSWNRELAWKVGAAIGEECQAEDVQIVLGPGANIKRSPLCGRNFEYFSEDPYLSGQMAAAHIEGVQSQGVGASLKHFAVNNQETRRFNINVVIDERTLREIYLTSFECAVKEGKPWTVMCAYNQINGEYCSKNKRLLTDILRDEWGFEGFVVSDWFAACERDLGLLAGLDLEMPTSAGIGSRLIIEGVKSGKIPMETLDKAVERILCVTKAAADCRKPGSIYDKAAHHAIAKEAALESMVLLKNDSGLLPLKASGRIAVIGAFAKSPRYQGAGSSRINATQVDIPLDEIIRAANGAAVTFADGYTLDNGHINADMLETAKQTAIAADVCLVFAGLPDREDSEGSDRKHMRLPENQNALIEAVTRVQKNIVVILMNGSAVEMPWIGRVPAVLEAYLGGQAMAGALADLLFGKANPCGKLAETFPVKLNDTPCYLNFPGERNKVEYREGFFVGYRHYDTVRVMPLFPFGYGLSYTAFAYSNLRLDKTEMLDTDEITVRVNVTNTGAVAGKEIVQLYVRDKDTTMLRPDKELKGFAKIALKPGETGEVSFVLGKRAFALYDPDINDWRVESGEFEILIGKSSAEIPLSGMVYVTSTTPVKKCYTLDSTLYDIKDEPAAASLMGMMMGGSQGGTALGMDVDAVLSSMKVRSLAAISAVRSGGKHTISIEQLFGLIAAMNSD